LGGFVTIEKNLGPDGRIAAVRFDRGDGINALSPDALRELTAAAHSFEDDGATSVVVLTGSAKAFSAGFDLKDPEGRSRRNMNLGTLRRHLKLGPRLTRSWEDMEQITIGAIEGFCVGGGGIGFPHHGARRASAGPGDRPRHEHELAERAAHAASDRTGPHQAGRDPRRSAHLGRRGL
jgi:hypothetical protein